MEQYQKECLEIHNRLRERHGSPSLVWSGELARGALTWAENLAETHCLQYDLHCDTGENIAMAAGKDLTADMACQMWYSEIKDYDFSAPGASAGANHFTQMVWWESRYFGVGRATSIMGHRFLVARYYPPGNKPQCYQKNVLPPIAPPDPSSERGRDAAKRALTAPQPDTTLNRNIKHPDRTDWTKRTEEDPQQFHRLDENGLLEMDFGRGALLQLNMYRLQHGVPVLMWSDALYLRALKVASDFASKKKFSGESFGPTNTFLVCCYYLKTGDEIISKWYGERCDYNYTSPESGSSTASRRFTQLVWKDTKEFAIARVPAMKDFYYAAAVFSPRGNIQGQHRQNVLPPTRLSG